MTPPQDAQKGAVAPPSDERFERDWLLQEQTHIMATFIKIQRTLIPSPPEDSEPYWCYSHTLIFHDRATKEKVWEQEIPEAELRWVEQDNDGRKYDTFDKYFWPFRVFYEPRFGWQLEFMMSHQRAKKWLAAMLAEREAHHTAHFAIQPPPPSSPLQEASGT